MYNIALRMRTGSLFASTLGMRVHHNLLQLIMGASNIGKALAY